jgi:formylglycine-generating enzyme required for sulfatase activity
VVVILSLLIACRGTPEPVGAKAPVAEAPPAAPRLVPGTAILARPEPVGAPIAYEAVDVEGGSFAMGSLPSEPGRDDDERNHVVTLSRGFRMGKIEVTQALWDQVMELNPSRVKDPALPVDRVAWIDAIAFANALSARDGLAPAYTVSGTDVAWNVEANGWRLPTEAEWEFAARGSATAVHDFAGSDDVDAVAWTQTNAKGSSHPPCQKAANLLGICDMSGNVREWTWDRYAPYAGSPETDPSGPTGGQQRTLRGGAYSDTFTQARVANRNRGLPGVRFVVNGLRLARNR